MWSIFIKYRQVFKRITPHSFPLPSLKEVWKMYKFRNAPLTFLFATKHGWRLKKLSFYVLTTDILSSYSGKNKKPLESHNKKNTSLFIVFFWHHRFKHRDSNDSFIGCSFLWKRSWKCWGYITQCFGHSSNLSSLAAKDHWVLKAMTSPASHSLCRLVTFIMSRTNVPFAPGTVCKHTWCLGALGIEITRQAVAARLWMCGHRAVSSATRSVTRSIHFAQTQFWV